jgi:hypothetical protein
VSADHATLADADVGKHNGAKAEKGPVSDLNECVIILDQTSNLDSGSDIVEWMSCINNGTIRGDGNVVTDHNAVMTDDMYVLFDSGVVPDA